jgi:hypothetical protein
VECRVGADDVLEKPAQFSGSLRLVKKKFPPGRSQAAGLPHRANQQQDSGKLPIEFSRCFVVLPSRNPA